MATAILLETDRVEDRLAQRAAAPGLLPAGGKALLTHVARALRQLSDIDKLVLVGPTAYQEQTGVLAQVDDALLLDAPVGALVEAACERFGGADELLLCRPNTPLLRPEMVERFLAHAPLDAALNLTVVREERFRASFPELPEPPVSHLGAERVVWASLVLVRPAALSGHRALLQRVLGEQLVHAELAKALGVGFAIKLSTGRASVDELARRLSDLLGAPAVIHFAPFPELALRVHGRAEYHLARELLEAA